MNLKNVEKIDWEYIGVYKRNKQKVFGQLRDVRCCPVCNEKEMHLYKSKGRFKIMCHKCKYVRVDTKVDIEQQTNNTMEVGV